MHHILSLTIRSLALLADTQQEARCLQECSDEYEQCFDPCRLQSPDESDCAPCDEALTKCQSHCQSPPPDTPE